MSANLGHYPPNPSYGKGVFRRRIAFTRWGNGIHAEVQDDFHEMAVALLVEEGVIVDVIARMDRYPKTTCPGAVAALGMLRGRVADGGACAPANLEQGGQCTHLVDLARLALSWLNRDETDQVVEIALTDRDEAARQQLTISIDGRVRLDWRLENEIIVCPEQHRGRTLFGGFGRWVEETFPMPDADFWRIAQMAVFVARGRAYIVDGPQPRYVSEEPARRGACYSFSGAAFDTARDRVGYVRDMSDGFPPSARAAG